LCTRAAPSDSATGPIKRACVVCMDAGPTHALVPCGHQCVCATCSAALRACPLCRGAVASAVRVFTL
jgi:hypothetical protein